MLREFAASAVEGCILPQPCQDRSLRFLFYPLRVVDFAMGIIQDRQQFIPSLIGRARDLQMLQKSLRLDGKPVQMPACCCRGLRRSEVAALTMSHVQQRDGRWCIVDLVGKHGRVRTVPMPTWVKVAIDAWTCVAGVDDGQVFRAVNRSGQVQGTALSE